MPRYQADVLTLHAPFREAQRRLRDTPDETLVAQFAASAGQFDENDPRFPNAAWRPAEPEHEELAANIRAQLNADIDTAYGVIGPNNSPHYDQLAVSPARTWEHPPRPAMLIALWDEDFDVEGDEGEAFERLYTTNPVHRLRTLGVCDVEYDLAPTAPAVQPIGVSDALWADVPPDVERVLADTGTITFHTSPQVLYTNNTTTSRYSAGGLTYSPSPYRRVAYRSVVMPDDDEPENS